MTSDQLCPVTQKNALALANAIEIGVGVLANVAGNDIANTLQGDTLTREQMGSLLASKLSRLIETNGKE